MPREDVCPQTPLAPATAVRRKEFDMENRSDRPSNLENEESEEEPVPSSHSQIKLFTSQRPTIHRSKNKDEEDKQKEHDHAKISSVDTSSSSAELLHSESFFADEEDNTEQVFKLGEDKPSGSVDDRTRVDEENVLKLAKCEERDVSGTQCDRKSRPYDVIGNHSFSGNNGIGKAGNQEGGNLDDGGREAVGGGGLDQKSGEHLDSTSESAMESETVMGLADEEMVGVELDDREFGGNFSVCDRPLKLKVKTKVTKHRLRCDICNKRLGLTSIRCRCGKSHCALHRYPREHDCPFDYRAMGAKEISQNNPRIIAEKVRKI